VGLLRLITRAWPVISPVAVPVLGVFFGVIAGASLVVPEDGSLFRVVAMILDGAFGSLDNISESLIYAIPLGFTGLAVALSYSAGIFNIGCEGQLQLGAVATTLIATSSNAFNGSPLLHTTLAITAGAIFGAIWALIPAVLKAYKGFSEIVVTMLLNYVAVLMVGYLVQGPMKDPAGDFPHSRLVADSAILKGILPFLNLHTGFWILLILLAAVYFIMYRTTFGFKLRAAGYNPQGAEYAGYNIKKIIIYTMLISGALSGMAGGIEILGVHYRLLEGFSPGYGFDAIAVALIANLNPFGVMASALFFGALRNAANSLQIELGIPVAFVYIIQGLSILFVVGSGKMPQIIRRIRKRLSFVQ
jgi:ABC-type uncharacterized transport system permease subunit